MRTDLLPRGRGWRMGIAVLAVVLVGATSGAAVWHEEHAGDQDCVCPLRHEPAATSFGAFHFEPADTSEPVARTTLARGVASGHGSRLPARAPPA